MDKPKQEQEKQTKTTSAGTTNTTPTTTTTATSNKAVFRPFEKISIMNPDKLKPTMPAGRPSTATTSKTSFERSADFGRFFNSNGSPTGSLGMNSPFLLSKDSSYLPSMDDVFKSKDSILSTNGLGGMFASNEWNMDFTRKFGGETMTQHDDDSYIEEQTKKMPEDTDVDVDDTDVVSTTEDLDSTPEEEKRIDVVEAALRRDIDPTTTHLKSADWVGTLGRHVELPPGAYTPVQMGWSPDVGVSVSSSGASVGGRSSSGGLKGGTLNSTDSWFQREFCDAMGIPRGSLGLSPAASTSSVDTTNHLQAAAVAPLPPVPVATVNDMNEPPALAEEPNIPTEARTSNEIAEKKNPNPKTTPTEAKANKEVARNKKPNPKRKRKRSPRKKIVPEVKEYVEPRRDIDVLCGRGGRSNHFPGNKRYRAEVSNLRQWYNDLTDKDRKTELSSCLVDFVKDYGGRFLELDKEVNRWYIIPDIAARRKASQALREDVDPEKRRAKRQRYLEKKRRLAAEAAVAAATADAEAASTIKNG